MTRHVYPFITHFENLQTNRTNQAAKKRRRKEEKENATNAEKVSFVCNQNYLTRSWREMLSKISPSIVSTALWLRNYLAIRMFVVKSCTSFKVDPKAKGQRPSSVFASLQATLVTTGWQHVQNSTSLMNSIFSAKGVA